YPSLKEPLYLNSLYLKNYEGTGLYEYSLPLEMEALRMADSCVEAWGTDIPTSSEMRLAQQSIAGYIYANYSQIPYNVAGLEQSPEFSTAVISCYPNPFNARTVIYLSGFDIKAEPVVRIYDILGRQVKTFENIFGPENSVVWDGEDDFENQLSSGVYFVRAETPDFAKTVKILLIK
ncbi:MAG: T9SS type A sorting domain-containing protein, partial [Candidatus Zixiibacteriota bacterium]